MYFDNGTQSTVLTLRQQLIYKSRQNKANQNKNAMLSSEYAMIIEVYAVMSADGLIHK